MNRRRCAAIAAITVLCALAVPVASGTAFAAPPAPRAAPAMPGAPAAPLLPSAPDPSGSTPEKSLDQVRLEIEDLYHQAVSATDAYNLAEERAQRQSAEIVRLAQSVVRGKDHIKKLKDRAGAAARAQYRGGGLPAEAQLMLTDDPQLFLDGVDRAKQGLKAATDLLDEMKRTQTELESYTESAGEQWRKLEATRLEQAEAKKKIKAKIKAAEELENRLEEKERARLLVLEREAAKKAQEEWLRSHALNDSTGGTGSGAGGAGGSDGRATARGEQAVKFARKQLGKPYEWGAEGPGSYDCSGLTSQAWAAAGRNIPRTSQEQWRQLPKVSVEDLRPGDLIIYHADASHVGMYIGDGSIVHAPRPGRQVSVTGAGSMKILGVVRPDS